MTFRFSYQKNDYPARLFLLMSVLPQAFFTLVGSHFMSFSLFPAWHVDLFLYV